MVQPIIQSKYEKNIGKLFIKLVRKHFTKNSKWHKILYLNTLKLRYCCTTNVVNIIKQHNSKVLIRANDNNNRKCNCRSKPICPLNGQCLTQRLVYKAKSTTSSNSFVYYENSEVEFKSRYRNVTKSFRHRECMNDTELSKPCVELKRPWSREQSLMGNPQKGLTIPVWLKTLRSMFVGKSFHNLC